MSTPACIDSIKLNCPAPLPTRKNGICDEVVHIGLFFDGTGNNMKTDSPYNSQSNVVRLINTYPH